MTFPATLSIAACEILSTPEPAEKVRLTHIYGQAWLDGDISTIGNSVPLTDPARPEKPILCTPREMPKRSTGGGKRRTALVHAIAHIELNAIDLGWDIIARFSDVSMPKAFYDDWVNVAKDEARHFDMLQQRLADLDATYGDIPAHNGLWEAATNSADDLLNRLALVPMILEARGLDTTPGTVEKLITNGDHATAELLRIIADDEISHVAAGVRWFEDICRTRGLEPIATFKKILGERFRGKLKPPFNTHARSAAGMRAAYYETIE